MPAAKAGGKRTSRESFAAEESMRTDIYQSPLSERYADAVYFFTGYEVSYLEKTVDCPGLNREGIRTEPKRKAGNYPGADRRA